MYESTVNVLYHMYEKVSVGGYVIIDDWGIEETRQACEDFFKVHKINPTIVAIDSFASYWKKDIQFKLQYWRFEQKKFT